MPKSVNNLWCNYTGNEIELCGTSAGLIEFADAISSAVVEPCLVLSESRPNGVYSQVVSDVLIQHGTGPIYFETLGVVLTIRGGFEALNLLAVNCAELATWTPAAEEDRLKTHIHLEWPSCDWVSERSYTVVLTLY